MLTPLAALPLLLAATLDAPPPAPTRPRADSYASAPQRTQEAPPAPSIEGAPRLPEPALRRAWCAEGSDTAESGQPRAVGRGVTSPDVDADENVCVRRLRTRGPPSRES